MRVKCFEDLQKWKRNKDRKFQCFVTKQKLVNIYQPLFLYYLLHLFYTP